MKSKLVRQYKTVMTLVFTHYGSFYSTNFIPRILLWLPLKEEKIIIRSAAKHSGHRVCQ